MACLTPEMPFCIHSENITRWTEQTLHTLHGVSGVHMGTGRVSLIDDGGGGGGHRW